MSKYIQITANQIKNLTTNRLLNIFRINRKYLFNTLNNFGYDTSKCYNSVNWNFANDELYYHLEFNTIYSLNEDIKKELNKRKINE